MCLLRLWMAGCCPAGGEAFISNNAWACEPGTALQVMWGHAEAQPAGGSQPDTCMLRTGCDQVEASASEAGG